MFIAHAPAGYITSTLLAGRFRAWGVPERQFIVAGVCGALAPDLDKVYFFFAGEPRLLHHQYFPHFPLLWCALLAASLAWLSMDRQRKYPALCVIFNLNALLHMVLDTVTGKIWWLAPFVDRPFELFPIPPRYPMLWMNVVLHWTFVFELAIVLWAVLLFRKRIRQRQGLAP